MTIGWVIFIIIMLAVVGTVAIWDGDHAKQTACVRCQSDKVVEVERRAFGKQPLQFMGGGLKTDAPVRVRRDVEVAYRCQACGKGFCHRATMMS